MVRPAKGAAISWAGLKGPCDSKPNLRDWDELLSGDRFLIPDHGRSGEGDDEDSQGMDCLPIQT